MPNFNDETPLPDAWKSLLKTEFSKPYFLSLQCFITSERKKHIVFPPQDLVYEALKRTPPEKVKAIILGQDPYHGSGQAHGLCFSVPAGIKFPPSLRNIFKELKSDLGIDIPLSGDLSAWADQGVLLLNTTLTVRKGEAGSHQKKGWEIFTDEIIRLLSEQYTGIVFILWGGYAQAKEKLIDQTKHFVLKANHPSPLSANRGGFFGCRHFSKTNQLLESIHRETINWSLQ